MAIELQLLDLDLAVAKLSEIEKSDAVFAKAKFASFTKTEDEISLVVDIQSLPKHEYANEGWKAFKIVGPIDFSLVGILQQIIRPLSENGISIFTISTFDTDYILVKEQQLQSAIKVLKEKFEIRNSE
jgi:hypothetical protein